MKTIFTTLCLISIISSSSCLIFEDNENPSSFNVLNYGAVGDGQKDASQAFLRAWRDACGASGGTPTLLIPASKTFLLKPLTFQGPCRSNRINIQISGTIRAPSVWDGKKQDKWIRFSDIDGLTVYGKGIFDGRGDAWWGRVGVTSRPTAVHFFKCNGLRVTGTTHINSPRNHISINNCRGVVVSHLQMLAPEESPNTDGIDISQSSYVKIHHCKIQTGDDCIAVNGFTSHVNITNVFCGPGHGISIGSLGRGGAYETVEEIHVRRVTLKGTQNGVRIKTWKGGSGYVRKISFEDILLVNAENPIIIDQHYVDDSLNGYSSDVKISDITYRNIRGSSAEEEAIKLYCSDSLGCSNILMSNVRINPAKHGEQTYAFCNNAHGRAISSFPIVSCLK